MRVRFNGMFVNGTKRRCNCAGGGSVTGRVFLTHKTFVLPSGQTRAFSVGEEYEVPDIDGNFLLSYSQIDKNGVKQDSFTRLD